jgi:hypothetical protein
MLHVSAVVGHHQALHKYKTTVEHGYNVMKRTEYFMSL